MPTGLMLDDALFERALVWLVRQRGEAHVAGARHAFEQATGAIHEGASDYEQRISHFLERMLCDGTPPPIAQFAEAAPELDDDARRQLAGWAHSHRALLLFEGFYAEGGRVRDCLLDGVFHVWPSEHDRKLQPGECFDGRIVPVGGLLLLSPGRVYHPREAHGALHALLARLDRSSLPIAALLDALLSMRSRFLEFESIRAEHIYQAGALAPARLPMRAGTSRG